MPPIDDGRRSPIPITAICLLALSATAALPARADDRERTTVIGTVATTEGSSKIHTEVVEECIQTLPSPDQLRPVTDAKAEYLKAINGDPNDSGSVRTWSAVVSVTYSLYQKKLVVVTTSSVERSEPVLKEVEGRFDRSVQFQSNSDNGDAFAGIGLAKKYYFSTPEKAAADAVRRAEAWIEEKRGFLCGPGGGGG